MTMSNAPIKQAANAPIYGMKERIAVSTAIRLAYGRRKTVNATNISRPRITASIHCPEKNLEYVSFTRLDM